VLALAVEDIPVPAEELHAVGIPLPGGQTAVCALPRETLLSLDRSPGGLRPAAVPAFLDGLARADDFEMLVGEFEPRSSRAARARSHLIAAVAVALCAGLIALGLSRRAEAARRAAVEFGSAADRLAFDAVGATDTRLLREQADAAEAHQRVWRELKMPQDRSGPLAAFLAGWPSGIEAVPQSVSFRQDAAAASVTLPGDAVAFLRAIQAPSGWLLEEPRVDAGAAGTRVTLRLRPGGAGP
jgi:hypothetical protein